MISGRFVKRFDVTVRDGDATKECGHDLHHGSRVEPFVRAMIWRIIFGNDLSILRDQERKSLSGDAGVECLPDGVG
jgi:hypothetical protein